MFSRLATPRLAKVPRGMACGEGGARVLVSWAPASTFQALGATVAGAGALATGGVALADDNVLHPPAYPWTFNGYFSSYDAAAIRRGHQVYTQVCATCHSLNRCVALSRRRRGGAAR